MMKFFQFLVQAIFWLQAFAAPVLVSGAIAFFVYANNENNKWLPITILVTGVIAGIWLAEFIRRKYGLDTFFARIYGPNKMDEKLKDTKK